MSLALSSDLADSAILLNLQEMALNLRTSRQTLALWLKKWPDFPVEQTGTNGRPFLLDPVKVREYLHARQEEQNRSRAERDEQLAQLTLMFEPPPGTQEVKGGLVLSLDEQLKAGKVREQQVREAERNGQLVRVGEMEPVLHDAFTTWGRLCRAAVAKAAREHNLPDAVARGIEAHISEAQRALRPALARLFEARGNRGMSDKMEAGLDLS